MRLLLVGYGKMGQLVEQMAAYSKSIWPTMPAIIRAFPDYLATYSGTYDHLDGVHRLRRRGLRAGGGQRGEGAGQGQHHDGKQLHGAAV